MIVDEDPNLPLNGLQVLHKLGGDPRGHVELRGRRSRGHLDARVGLGQVRGLVGMIQQRKVRAPPGSERGGFQMDPFSGPAPLLHPALDFDG